MTYNPNAWNQNFLTQDNAYNQQFNTQQPAGNNIWQTDHTGGTDMAGGSINNNINPTGNGLLQVNNPGTIGFDSNYWNNGSENFGQRNFNTQTGTGQSSNFAVGMPELDDDDFNFENTQPGMFGKENGFGSGQGFLSKIGKGGEGFMGKFGTGEGKIAQAFGDFDMGKAGQAIGSGLQNIGANMGQGFQFGGYGQQNRGKY